MKTKRYLMREVYYKQTSESDWVLFCPSEGDPTGKIYEFWLPETIRCTMEEITAYLNMYVSCIYEKKLENIHSLKFDLLLSPDEDASRSGYDKIHLWDRQRVIFESCN